MLFDQGGFSELQGADGVQRFCIIKVEWGDERLPQVRFYNSLLTRFNF